MKTYLVKTRNWHQRKLIFYLLNISKLWGVQRGDGYDDGDGKFYLETNNWQVALLTWYYFSLWERFSGGWTYIYSNGRYLKNNGGIVTA